MSGATVGFSGKLPSHGDFLERRVGSAFRDPWDDWMQRCIVESQQELAGRWLDCYLTSPMWRFFFCGGFSSSPRLPRLVRAARGPACGGLSLAVWCDVAFGLTP